MHLIEVDNVTKSFRPRTGPQTLLTAGGFASRFRRNTERVTALSDISFSVDPGESIGIIGANGSGKSTLLKLLAGVSVPTQGRVTVRGRVASLLELGAGFHPLLTGRENVYLNARILGLGRAQVDQVFNEIVAFSGIAEFIDNPVNTYSSGMFVRLGFAVAVHTGPDIFLIDEVLSVGDEEFQRKCRTRIGELRERGKTLIFVSHDLGIVNSLCSRVILLTHGKMITRRTPQAAIEYYLRQIGSANGIHTFSAGPFELIFCHGRISIFHNQIEITAGAGFQMEFECMGQYHFSINADWTVAERRDDGCTARGRMSRLPLILIWDMSINEDGHITWRLSAECEHEATITMLAANLHWITSYTEWIYGDVSGVFPEILHGDLKRTQVVSSEATCRDTAILPPEDAAIPPVVARIESKIAQAGFVLSNSDSVTDARVLQAAARRPERDATLEPGHHDIMTLHVDLGLDRKRVFDLAREREAHRTVAAGSLKARFEAGKLRCSFDDCEFTSFLHLYSSALIANLWNDSHSLQWANPERDGQCLAIHGESRRFPYQQFWELEPLEEGIRLRIWLELAAPLEIQEYQVSIVLNAEYSHWETDHESGQFPPFEPGRTEWRHANQLYAAGKHASALSSSFPSVTLKITTEQIPFRMTVINTGFHENARVLQALRTPEAGFLRFEKGRHLYFEGLIAVDPDLRPATANNSRL